MSSRKILANLLGRSLCAQTRAFLLSQDALDEFSHQDVFKTIEEFVDAMPASVKAVHCVELKLELPKMAFIKKANSPESEWFGNKYFVNDSPEARGIDTDEHPGPEDSMWDLNNPSQDGAYDMAKQQDEQSNETGLKPLRHVDRVDMRDHGAETTQFVNPDINQTLPTAWPNWQLTDYPYRQKTNPRHSSVIVSLLEKDSLADLMVHYFPIRMVQSRQTKTALTIDDIARHVSEPVRQKALHCLPSLIRSDPKLGRWTFSVHCGGSGAHIVKVMAKPKGASKDVSKVDVFLGCSCPFWKYYGPDYWAHRNGFLEGEPRSNLKTPTVRDPAGKNWLCKHVLSASRLFRNYKIQTARPVMKRPGTPITSPTGAPSTGGLPPLGGITPPKAGPF